MRWEVSVTTVEDGGKVVFVGAYGALCWVCVMVIGIGKLVFEVLALDCGSKFL